jgi:hypothetical protein
MENGESNAGTQSQESVATQQRKPSDIGRFGSDIITLVAIILLFATTIFVIWLVELIGSLHSLLALAIYAVIVFLAIYYITKLRKKTTRQESFWMSGVIGVLEAAPKEAAICSVVALLAVLIGVPAAILGFTCKHLHVYQPDFFAFAGGDTANGSNWFYYGL